MKHQPDPRRGNCVFSVGEQLQLLHGRILGHTENGSGSSCCSLKRVQGTAQ